jgi:PAB-dependent poly(A)-specific ribonuclease subunit 3
MRNDVLEAELAKEVESSRLFRLLTKLSTVVDRAELNGDFGWSEYGDRYMLKLYRDYVFHQVRNYIYSPYLFLKFLNS